MQIQKRQHLLLLYGHRNGVSQHDVIRNAGRHVRHRQPEKLGVPAGGVAVAGPDGGHGVLHAADHLHQISVTHLANFFV